MSTPASGDDDVLSTTEKSGSPSPKGRALSPNTAGTQQEKGESPPAPPGERKSGKTKVSRQQLEAPAAKSKSNREKRREKEREKGQKLAQENRNKSRSHSGQSSPAVSSEGGDDISSVVLTSAEESAPSSAREGETGDRGEEERKKSVSTSGVREGAGASSVASAPASDARRIPSGSTDGDKLAAWTPKNDDRRALVHLNLTKHLDNPNSDFEKLQHNLRRFIRIPLLVYDDEEKEVAFEEFELGVGEVDGEVDENAAGKVDLKIDTKVEKKEEKKTEPKTPTLTANVIKPSKRAKSSPMRTGASVSPSQELQRAQPVQQQQHQQQQNQQQQLQYPQQQQQYPQHQPKQHTRQHQHQQQHQQYQQQQQQQQQQRDLQSPRTGSQTPLHHQHQFQGGHGGTAGSTQMIPGGAIGSPHAPMGSPQMMGSPQVQSPNIVLAPSVRPPGGGQPGVNTPPIFPPPHGKKGGPPIGGPFQMNPAQQMVLQMGGIPPPPHVMQMQNAQMMMQMQQMQQHQQQQQHHQQPQHQPHQQQQHHHQQGNARRQHSPQQHSKKSKKRQQQQHHQQQHSNQPQQQNRQDRGGPGEGKGGGQSSNMQYQ